MREIFVLYDSKSGRIDGGTGRVDRERDEKNKDGSTVSERIEKILAKYSEYAVIFLPDGELPNLAECYVDNGQIVQIEIPIKTLGISSQEQEQKIFSEMRNLAIQSLADRGEL